MMHVPRIMNVRYQIRSAGSRIVMSGRNIYEYQATITLLINKLIMTDTSFCFDLHRSSLVQYTEAAAIHTRAMFINRNNP